MTPHYILSSILVAIMLIGLGASLNYRAANGGPTRPVQVFADSAHYQILNAPAGLQQVEPSSIVPVKFEVKNTSRATWGPGAVYLDSVFTNGSRHRTSHWYDISWVSDTRIAPHDADLPVEWGDTANFEFIMKAPDYPGLYKESFDLVIAGSEELRERVTFTFEVLGIPGNMSLAPKEVRLYRNTQSAELWENGYIVANLPISTGKPGYITPPGKYKVMNKLPDAKSEKYGVWMGNWMGLVREGHGFEGYGMHSLAYWRVRDPSKFYEGQIYNDMLYTNGRLYEDTKHLGTPRSHGCIRFGIEQSAGVYSWIEVGTPVIVI